MSGMQRDAEGAEADVVGGERLNRGAVEGETHLPAVGKHLDLGLPTMAFGAPLTGDVDYRLRIPVGLVEVIGILLHLTVVRHQTFIVDPGTVALGAMRCAEVEHVPHERAPYIRTVGKNIPITDVVIGLPVFGMPPACGCRLSQ